MMKPMSEELTRERIDALRVELKPAERILQIIHLNFVVGASVVLGVLYFFSRNIAPNDAPVPLLFFIIGILPVVPSFIVPVLMRSTKLSAGESSEESIGKLAGIYQVSHIVGCILLESGLLFSALAFRFADAVPHWFILVPAILILVLLLRFPLPGKLTDWVITKLESRRD
jgi:hypothetical protein